LGASISFTTLFGATRGRLDVIAWAFTSFIFVMLNCGLARMLHNARVLTLNPGGFTHSGILVLLHLAFLLGMVFPLMSGITLLVVAVALLDKQDTGTAGISWTAARVAGYAAVLGLFYSLLLMFYMFYSYKYWTPLAFRSGDETTACRFPSHVLQQKSSKWDYFPGGPKYSDYRDLRRSDVVSVTPPPYFIRGIFFSSFDKWQQKPPHSNAEPPGSARRDVLDNPAPRALPAEPIEVIPST
jgi:hypothetical protein